MEGLKRFAPVLLLLAVWPAPALAQTAGESSRNVGVVTTLAGNATVTRAALPAPQALRFKDDVFLRDRISTAERSIVRVLLGGKALVTVRELSALTITEDTGRSIVDLSSGKIAMGVLRQRMRPGEVIEIRTPNAIAAIRGTVLVVELIPEPGGTPAAPRYTTKVHVLHGLVEVSDPKNPGAPPAQVGALESWSRTGSEPSVLVPMTPVAAEQVFEGLHAAPQIVEGPGEFIHGVTVREQAKAVAVAEFLAPEVAGAGAGAGGDNGAPAAPPGARNATPGIADAPVVPLIASSSSQPAADGPTALARFSLTGQTVTQPGSLYSLSSGLTDTPAGPILEAVNSSLAVGQSLMEISGGATFMSTGTAPLLYFDPGNLSVSRVLTLSGGATASFMGSLFQDHSGTLALQSDFLQVSGGGTISGGGTSAFIDLVGSSAGSAGGLLSASSGAVMDLLAASAPLLSMTRSATLTTASSLVDVSGGAQVKLSQLASLTASSLTVQGHGLNLSGGGRMTITGDLFRLANGSTLTIANGALLNLSGGSILNVTGALVNFVGTGNTLNITNNLCGNGCAMIGNLNLPVFVPAGVQLGQAIMLNNPILNLAGNTLNITAGSAAIVVTGGGQVKQGP